MLCLDTRPVLLSLTLSPAPPICKGIQHASRPASQADPDPDPGEPGWDSDERIPADLPTYLPTHLPYPAS